MTVYVQLGLANSNLVISNFPLFHYSNSELFSLDLPFSHLTIDYFELLFQTTVSIFHFPCEFKIAKVNCACVHAGSKGIILLDKK